jgi:hypothetical protein
MPTHREFRRIALGMKGAIESAHMGHPDFRIHGRIFATLHPDLEHGMVKLTPEQQDRFVEEDPESFVPENGAWGRQGSTRVRLDSVAETALVMSLTLAWQNIAEKHARGRSPGASRTTRPAKPPRKR